MSNMSKGNWLDAINANDELRKRADSIQAAALLASQTLVGASTPAPVLSFPSTFSADEMEILAGMLVWDEGQQWPTTERDGVVLGGEIHGVTVMLSSVRAVAL
jgi:hypothetical protein